MPEFELKQRLPEFPLLGSDKALLAMAQAAVEIGESFLNADRAGSMVPLLAEQRGANIINVFEPSSIIHGKQFQNDVDISSGTHFLIHGVNGYANYTHGLENWDVSVARVRNHKIESGVVFVPEFGRLYYASLGEGAYLNGNRFKAVPQRPFREALIEVAPLFLRGEDMRESRAIEAIRNAIREIADTYQMTTREVQSGGKSLCELAEGKLDGYASSWTGAGNLPAGVLIAREAGVIATNIEGEEWQPGNLGVIAGTPSVYPEWIRLIHLYHSHDIRS